MIHDCARATYNFSASFSNICLRPDLYWSGGTTITWLPTIFTSNVCNLLNKNNKKTLIRNVQLQLTPQYGLHSAGGHRLSWELKQPQIFFQVFVALSTEWPNLGAVLRISCEFTCTSIDLWDRSTCTTGHDILYVNCFNIFLFFNIFFFTQIMALSMFYMQIACTNCTTLNSGLG